MGRAKRVLHKLTVLARFLLMPVLMLAAAGLLLVSAGNVDSRQKAEQMQQVQEAVNRAVLSCYAIEGSYPATVAYIEEHYGLQIDHDRYEVFYEIFADNVMPEITVVEKE